MTETLHSLIQERHAFYDVLPYYVVVDDAKNGSVSITTRRVHAGFDVDIYGESRKNAGHTRSRSRLHTWLFRVTKDGRRAFASCDGFLLIRGFGVSCDGLLRSSTPRAGSVAPHQNFTLPGSQSTGGTTRTTCARGTGKRTQEPGCRTTMTNENLR
jgi:hypothetical protein